MAPPSKPETTTSYITDLTAPPGKGTVKLTSVFSAQHSGSPSAGSQVSGFSYCLCSQKLWRNRPKWYRRPTPSAGRFKVAAESR